MTSHGYFKHRYPPTCGEVPDYHEGVDMPAAIKGNPESLYAQYMKEREDIDIIEKDNGYCTYKELGEDGLWIIDIFVEKDYRRTRLCYKMADEVAVIAKEKGLKYLYGSVDPKTNGATASMRMILNYGYEVYMLDENLIWFRKDLEA